MKQNDKFRLVWIFAVVFLIMALAYSTSSKAQESYGVTGNPSVYFVQPEKVTVEAEKVMNGITDIVITTQYNQRVDKFILQCDTSTESSSIFYYTQDKWGNKANHATGMSIQFYKHGTKVPEDQNQVGRRYTYITTQDHNSLRDGLQALPEIQGMGFWVMHFFKTEGRERKSIAWSMMIEPKVATEILEKLDSIKDGSKCDYHSEFNSLYQLRTLNDEVG